MPGLDSLGLAEPRDRLREAISCHAPSPQNREESAHPGPVFVTISVCSWVSPVGHPPLLPHPAFPCWIPHLASVCLSAVSPTSHGVSPHLWTWGRGQGAWAWNSSSSGPQSTRRGPLAPSWFWHAGSSSTVVGASGGQVLSTPRCLLAQPGQAGPTNVGSAPLEGGARLNGGVLCQGEGREGLPAWAPAAPPTTTRLLCLQKLQLESRKYPGGGGGSSGAQSLHWPEAARLGPGKPESNSLTAQPYPVPPPTPTLFSTSIQPQFPTSSLGCPVCWLSTHPALHPTPGSECSSSLFPHRTICPCCPLPLLITLCLTIFQSHVGANRYRPLVGAGELLWWLKW